jgi:multiple sugar transport system substrate-binding protein
MTSRRIAILAALIPGAAAACAIPPPGGERAGGAAPTPGLRSGVTVTFAQGGNQTNADGRKEIFAAFEAKFPQIKAELLFQPNDLAGKIQALISAGTPPDLLNVGNGAAVTSYVVTGALQDLSPFARRDRFNTSDFFDSSLPQYAVCGRQYAYPVDFANQELFYNAELFDQAGVKTPPGDWNDSSWTFDRFLDAARRLTKQSGDGGTGAGTQWGYVTLHNSFRNWWVWVAANGGELLDKDLKTCTLADAPAVEALQFLQDLVHKHRVMPTVQEYGQIQGGLIGGLAGGQAASITLQPAIGQVRRDMKQRWDIAPHPRGSGAKARWACAGGGTGVAMAASGVGAKNLNEAWELLKFCESRPAVETWVRVVGTVPPLKSVADSPVFADPSMPPKSVRVFTDGAKYLRADPPITRWTEITRIMSDEMAKLWANSQNARATADAIKRGVDPILKEIEASGQLACTAGK